MSVDYFLFRVPSDRSSLLEKLEQPLPFGSQDNIIEHLSAIGFEVVNRESPANVGPWAVVVYTYPHKNDEGRQIEFHLQGDPVDCISINRAYPEDFLPVLVALEEFAPFVIWGPREPFTPSDFSYSYNDWMHKNYEEGWLLPLSYEKTSA